MFVYNRVHKLRTIWMSSIQIPTVFWKAQFNLTQNKFSGNFKSKKIPLKNILKGYAQPRLFYLYTSFKQILKSTPKFGRRRYRKVTQLAKDWPNSVTLLWFVRKNLNFRKKRRKFAKLRSRTGPPVNCRENLKSKNSRFTLVRIIFKVQKHV